MSSEGTSDYKVGRGKPPEHTRFKKGQSGNPRGRPKRSNNLRQLRDQVLDEVIPVKENGKIRNVSTVEAAFLKTKQLALQGDRAALRQIFEWAEERQNTNAEPESDRVRMIEVYKRVSESALLEFRQAHIDVSQKLK